MPTLNELAAAAAAADQRVRKARADAARLRREIEKAQAARVADQERLVGAAIMAWCKADERARTMMARYLRGHLGGTANIKLLAGSVLDLGGGEQVGESLDQPAAE